MKNAGNTKGKEENKNEQLVKVIEYPVSVPYTCESRLKKALQSVDDTLCQCLGSPSVRFVEWYGGQTITEFLDASNPWAREVRVVRTNYLPCKGKDLLAMEEALRPLPTRPSREEVKSLPKCTTEGV